MKARNLLCVYIAAVIAVLLLTGPSSTFALDILAYIPQMNNRMQSGFFSYDAKENHDIRNAIVRIYAESKIYSVNPWTAVESGKAKGSGCILRGNMILTNAHVVADSAVIQVRKHGESKKHPASVQYISHEFDLALLHVGDEQFFADVEPLEIGELPYINQNISIYGFPGEETLVITRGVFSRIEYQNYIHHNNVYFAGRLNASVMPGNSGSPVIVDDKIVGLIMQSRRKGDIALMVPGLIIKHFLKDIADGHYDCLPDINLITRTLGGSHISKHHEKKSDKVLFQPISFL